MVPPRLKRRRRPLAKLVPLAGEEPASTASPRAGTQGLVVVTRNVRHLARVPDLAVESWGTS
jgi:hypothetical protein